MHTPDLFDGQVASTIEQGMAIADGLPEGVLADRVEAALADQPDGVGQ